MNLYVISTAPVVAIFGAVTVWLIKAWLQDLKFYRENGWNYKIDSKHSGTIHHGEDGEGPPVSNQARVLIVYPIMIICFLVITIGLVASMFGDSASLGD